MGLPPPSAAAGSVFSAFIIPRISFLRPALHNDDPLLKTSEISQDLEVVNWLLYCVMVFTASPTLKPEPETGVPTAEISSTSVSRITPTGEVRRRITAPVDGSLISFVTLCTVS